MRSSTTRLLTAALLFVTAAYAVAEDITLSTYYPSPRGVYETLRTTGLTTLAEINGGVAIGKPAPAAGVNLDVVGTIQSDNLNITALSCPGCVGNGQLANDAVTSAKIQDGQVTSADIQDGGVNTIDIANLAVGTNQLANLAVTT